MNRILKNSLLALILTAFAACSGGSGTTIVGNPTSSSSSTITLSQLSGEESTITVPLSVFESTPTISAGLSGRLLTGGSSGASASTSSLEGATIDIKINGVLTNEGLSAEDNYQESLQSVVFILTSLQDGDEVTIIVHKNDGTDVSFTGSVSADAETEVVSDFGALEGAAALADRDLASAVEEYCGAYENGDTDSSTAFGCYLAKAFSLPETSDFAAILADFNEGPVNVTEDILGDVVDSFTGEGERPSYFIYTDYENLPFNSFLAGSASTVEKLAQFAVGLNATGTTAQALQTDVDALYADFEELEDLLEVVLDDADFAYEIPEDLFGSEGNLPVNYTQARLHMGSVQAVLVGLDIFAAYDFGATPADVVNSDDTDFDQEILTADLNGTGETVKGVTVDTTPFLTLTNEARITGASARAAQALENLSAGLSIFDDHAEAFFLWQEADGIMTIDVRTLLDDLLTSLNDDVMVGVGEIGGREVSVNLHAFFTDPPSAADVDSSDPFVFEDGAIQFVETYFEDLLDGIAEFGE